MKLTREDRRFLKRESDKEKASHTPGPWRVSGQRTGGAVAIVAKLQYATTQTESSIAWAARGAAGGGDANASLISAAPELLSVALLAEELATNFPERSGMIALGELARAAIAKAGGKP